MATLQQAIEKISVCITPSTKYARPQVRIHDGVVTAYNGILAGSSPFTADFPDEPIVVDADSLKRVWVDGAKARVKDGQLQIRTRRTSYTIRILDDVFECPELKSGGDKITPAQRDAILLAAKWSSVNAQHAWACGCLVSNGRAVATNNISVVSVECDAKLDTTLPSWAVQALGSSDVPPQVRVEHTGITFTFDDGTIIHSAPLAVQMPEKLFELIESLENGDVSIQPIKDVAEDAFRIPGRRVTIDPVSKLLTVVSEQENKSETDLDLDVVGAAVTLQEPVLRIILENATHIGFAEAPGKLLFSSDQTPRFHGVCAAMVM
jgi:hypothetical protein